MFGEWIKPLAVIVGAGVLGTYARFGLDDWLGEEVVALAAVNMVGWFLLGLVSGRYGSRVRRLPLFLLALGVTAFTSWMPLAIHRNLMAGDVIVAFLEMAFGLAFAGVGHLVTMPRGPDLQT